MVVKEGSIVIQISDDKQVRTNFRVEKLEGGYATIRSLSSYLLTQDHVDNLSVLYQTDYFDAGDTVRVREEYVDKYSEADGGNDLTVVVDSYVHGRVSTTAVANNEGEEFNLLTDRLYLVKPVKSFKAGDRVVVDPDLAKKYGDEDNYVFWASAGVLVLTEDSGSRKYKTTSHVKYETNGYTNNVPTRWLKPYEEPAKRVVGETIKVADVKVGDKVKASYTMGGLLSEFTGVVASTVKLTNEVSVHAKDDDGAFGSAFPYESRGAVFTLLEEAPEPVDENLQRLLDAEIGDIAFGTYADEYWKKLGEDQWRLIRDEDSQAMIRNSEGVFGALYKLKYGELHFYKKVKDAD